MPSAVELYGAQSALGFATARAWGVHEPTDDLDNRSIVECADQRRGRWLNSLFPLTNRLYTYKKYTYESGTTGCSILTQRGGHSMGTSTLRETPDPAAGCLFFSL